VDRALWKRGRPRRAPSVPTWLNRACEGNTRGNSSDVSEVALGLLLSLSSLALPCLLAVAQHRGKPKSCFFKRADFSSVDCPPTPLIPSYILNPPPRPSYGRLLSCLFSPGTVWLAMDAPSGALGDPRLTIRWREGLRAQGFVFYFYLFFLGGLRGSGFGGGFRVRTGWVQFVLFFPPFVPLMDRRTPGWTSCPG
jgi:hypothetical protein